MTGTRRLALSALALCAGGVIGAHSEHAHARQVFATPARDAIAQAEVVAIAVVEQVSEQHSKCEDVVRYTLRPVEALRGALTEKHTRVEFMAVDLKAGPGCISASYSHPPRARTPKKGARLVITIKYNTVLKAYRAFSTHELSELPAIRRWLTAAPPAAKPAQPPAAKQPATKSSATKKSAAKKSAAKKSAAKKSAAKKSAAKKSAARPQR